MGAYDPFDKREQAKASEPDSGWVYLGAGRISPEEHRISTPDGVFEADILDKEGEKTDVHWSYETVTGTLILSSKALEDREYNTVGERSVLGPDNNYAINVPWQFFPPDGEDDPNRAAARAPEGARVEENERRHFVYQENTGMASGETRSCYLFTDEELMNRIKSPENLSGEFESAPQFL